MIKSHKVTKNNGWSKQCNANGLFFNPKRTLSLLRPLKTNNTSIIWNHLRLPRCCQERALTVTRSSDITSKLPIFELTIGCFSLCLFHVFWGNPSMIFKLQHRHPSSTLQSWMIHFKCQENAASFAFSQISSHGICFFFPGDSSWRSTGRWCAWWAWR